MIFEVRIDLSYKDLYYCSDNFIIDIYIHSNPQSLTSMELVKKSLQAKVITDQLSSSREDVEKAATTEEFISNDVWYKVDYILSLTGPIYDMLQLAKTDQPIIHVVNDV
jgi:hypothetical protein